MLHKIILLLFISLTVHTYAQQIENCDFQKKVKFQLIKQKGLQIDTLVIKTNGVYIHQDTIIDLNRKKRVRYSFYRFFDDGKVFMSCGYFNFPTQSDLNNLQYGVSGEYIVTGNEVCIESYNSQIGYFYKYLISNGQIIVDRYYSRRVKKPQRMEKVNKPKFYFVKL